MFGQMGLEGYLTAAFIAFCIIGYLLVSAARKIGGNKAARGLIGMLLGKWW